MVSWIDTNVLAVNDYSTIDEDLHEAIMEELKLSFPDIKIVLIPVIFDEGKAFDTVK